MRPEGQNVGGNATRVWAEQKLTGWKEREFGGVSGVPLPARVTQGQGRTLLPRRAGSGSVHTGFQLPRLPSPLRCLQES